MKKARGMKLDELHIGDRSARAPRHGHAVASRNVRIGRVKINLPATAGRKHDPIRSNGFNLSSLFIQAYKHRDSGLLPRNRAWQR